MGTLTEHLADQAMRTRWATLPETVRRDAVLRVLDTLGVATFASANTPWGRAVGALVAEEGSRGAATLIGRAERVAPQRAALANGSMALGFELEDTYEEGYAHPGAVIVPAALAAAEEAKADGPTFLAGIVVGYEVMGRIARAAGPALVKRGVHPTCSLGTFGAAAAAARILGISRDQWLDALGISGAYAGGLMQAPAEGASARRLHGGRPASSGLEAVALARLGITGPREVLEGDAGYLRVVAGGASGDLVRTDWGQPFVISQVSVKPYSSCRVFHTAVDAVLALRTEHRLAPEDVAAMRVEACLATPAHGQKDVPSAAGAQYRILYCVSTALRVGRLGPEEFTEDSLRHPVTRQLIDRAEAVAVPELAELSKGRSMPSRVSIRTRDGRELSRAVTYATGDPENPIAEPALTDKFRALAGRTLTPERTEALREAILTLPSSPDLGRLSAALAPR